MARHGERQPATERRPSHRALRRPVTSATTVEEVEARPGLWVRLRGLLGYLTIVALVGAGIAIAVIGGVAVAGRALETAVN